MQTEVAVAMGRRPVTAHGHDGSPIGRFQRGGFPGDDQEPVGPVGPADGTAGGYEAKGCVMPATYDCVHHGRGRMRPCIYGPAVGDAPGVPYADCVARQ